MDRQIRLMVCSLVIFCMLGGVFCFGTVSTRKIEHNNKMYHETLMEKNIIITEDEGGEEDE
jgi:hypothetical protein